MMKKGIPQNKAKKDGPVTRRNTPSSQGRTTSGGGFNGAVNPGSMTPERLFMMQQTLGNQAVSAMMQTPKQEEKLESPAPTISTRSVSIPASTMQRADGGSSATQTSTSTLKAKIAVAEGNESAFKEGEVIRIPDITFQLSTGQNSIEDAIASNIAYAGTTTESGSPGAGNFGLCTCSLSLSGVTATTAGGTITLQGNLNNTVTYSACATTGPNGEIDITSDSDAAITAANYNNVVTDLTPNMSDLNGRAPRSNFWSKALTLRHERFHANEYNTFGNQGFTAAITWLTGQTAANHGELTNLVNQVPQRIMNVINASMAYPGCEERAYGDGAASYTALANAIKTKGDNGNYT